jgi:hypothetical protein
LFQLSNLQPLTVGNLWKKQDGPAPFSGFLRPLYSAAESLIIDGVPGIERTRLAAVAGATALLTLGSALAWQMPWREYPGQDNIAIPPDFQEETEWVFGRLMYPPFPRPIHGRRPRGGFRANDWKQGQSSWTTDYTSADRHVALAFRIVSNYVVYSMTH